MNTEDYFSLIRLKLKPEDLCVEIDPNVLMHSYNQNTSTNTGTIEYFKIKKDTIDNVNKNLPSQLQSYIRDIRVAVVKGGNLIPHTDHGGSVCINFYLTTNDEKTIFYEANKNAVPIAYPGKDTNNVYKLDDVTEVCNFTAAQHSCYLVNISKIHSVIMNNTSNTRKILQITFNRDVSYKKIFSVLDELQLIVQH
jgi:hypothetical protein